MNAPTDPARHLDGASHETLNAIAKERGLAGRSRMTKSELRDALRDQAEPTTSQPVGSRVEQFRRLAEAAAGGDVVMLPRSLTGHDRRIHVRRTLREDHQNRIARQAEDTGVKFEKLAASPYSFFRGTALLFYRDMAGEDARMPTVLALGDVHPENFGIMPNADNVPIFGVNDFDEACYAPFTWDIKRGAAGFMIAAGEIGGYGGKKQRTIAARFVRGYIDGIRHFAEASSERSYQVRLDNAPPLIRDLIKGALKDRGKWLEKKYLDEFKRGFRASKKLVPVSTRRDEFQELIDRWIKKNAIEPPARAGEMKVKDVAIRRGQGTASLGLPRYYVLIEGPAGDGTDDLLIEFKQARLTALAGLTPPSDFASGSKGDRIVHAQAVQLVRGDVFFGSVEFEGKSFMSRERAPFRDDVDLDDLSGSEWKAYAAICGQTLAHAHALSDETGELDYDVEPAIADATTPSGLFVDDVVGFADEAAARVRRDHALFQLDHDLGAFRTIDIVYR